MNKKNEKTLIPANKHKQRFSLDDLQLFLLSFPTLIWYLLFCYLPMFGLVIAFKKYKVAPGKGFLYSLFKNSQWVGLDNFRFLFANNKETTLNMFRNTVGYNIVFIILGIVVPVTLAIMISHLRSQKLAKVCQTAMFLPHFMSWVVVGYFVFSFLSTDNGLVNRILIALGKDPIKWYQGEAIGNPDDYPLKLAKSGITSWQNCLADWISMEYLIGLDWEAQGTDQELVVKSALQIPAWTERLETIHKWYEAGYINPDAAITESMGRSIAGVVQSGQGWFGAETVWSNARQKASYISRYDGPYLSTGSLRGSMTAISSTTEHPAEALALVQLMNTDPAYREIARYGIEGKHYVRNDDGTVTKTDLGNTNMSLWAYSQGFYNVGPIEASAFESVPADPDMWEKVFEGYADATVSAALGFTFDYSSVDSQCLAIASIIEEYKYELYTGTSDPAVVVPEMLDRMFEVGLQDVLDECQAQLDAFIAG